MPRGLDDNGYAPAVAKNAAAAADKAAAAARDAAPCRPDRELSIEVWDADFASADERIGFASVALPLPPKYLDAKPEEAWGEPFVGEARLMLSEDAPRPSNASRKDRARASPKAGSAS